MPAAIQMPTKTEGLNAEPIKVLLVEDNEGYSYFVKDVLLTRTFHERRV